MRKTILDYIELEKKVDRKNRKIKTDFTIGEVCFLEVTYEKDTI